jgi:hypothetical protein
MQIGTIKIIVVSFCLAYPYAPSSVNLALHREAVMSNAMLTG